jgi:hypothetical protein
MAAPFTSVIHHRLNLIECHNPAAFRFVQIGGIVPILILGRGVSAQCPVVADHRREE